jgi:hypothetical protein
MSDFDFPFEMTDEIGEWLHQVRADGIVERHMMIPQGYSFAQLEDPRYRKIFMLDVTIMNDIWIEQQKPCLECGSTWHVSGDYSQWAELVHVGHTVPRHRVDGASLVGLVIDA